MTSHLFLLTQIHEYGCIIKVGTMEEIVTASFRLLKVLMLCGGPNGMYEYRVGMTLHLLQMMWLQSVNHPVWQMLQADPNCINEEKGEICFSVLARGLAGNPCRHSVEKISEMFIMTKEQLEVAADMRLDLCGEDDEETRGNRATIDAKGPDYAAVTAHFKGVVRNMRARTWTHYTLDSKITKILDARDGRAKSVSPTDMNVWYHAEVPQAWINLLMAKTVEQTQTRWAADFDSLWPEVKLGGGGEGKLAIGGGAAGEAHAVEDAEEEDLFGNVDLPDQPVLADLGEAGSAVVPLKRNRGREVRNAARINHAREAAFEENCIPERILGERVIRGQKQYFIKWMGFIEKTWQEADQYDDDEAFSKLVADWKEQEAASALKPRKEEEEKTEVIRQ